MERGQGVLVHFVDVRVQQIRWVLHLLGVFLWRILIQPWERLFLTESHLKQQLDALDQQEEQVGGMPANNTPTLEVTEMNEEALTVQISAASGDGLKSSLSPTDSTDGSIEVVYNQEQPRPRGILKQRSRTLSDSSDDALSSSYNGGGSATSNASRQNSSNSTTSAESPITEESDGDGEEHSEDDDDDGDGEKSSGRTRHKSVSFSEHVDKATYKVNASVSSMTPALKSKRRRQRKMDQKRHEKHEQQQERRRRRSSGSEHSSGDELERNAGEKKNVANEKEEEEETFMPSEPSEPSEEPCSSETNNEKKENGERTSGKKSKKRKNRKGKGGKEKISGKAAETTTSDSDATGDGQRKEQTDHVKKETPVISEPKQVAKEETNGAGDSERTEKQNDATSETKDKEKSDSNITKVKLKQAEDDSDDDDDGGEKKEGGKEKKEVAKEREDEEENTMLSWNDGPVLPQQSAVVLNNSIMFDLDMD